MRSVSSTCFKPPKDLFVDRFCCKVGLFNLEIGVEIGLDIGFLQALEVGYSIGL